MSNFQNWAEALLQDLQYAVRTARKSPGFVLTATCTLALGIGANTAIFSLVSGVLLRPLPFDQPERLVQLNSIDPRYEMTAVYYRDVEEWRTQSNTVAEIVGYGNTSKSLLDQSEPERLQGVWAERGLFRMLGVAPLIGRTFREDDPLDVVVISAGLWKRRFGADPSLIGRKITLDRDPFTVIGVMPETFQFPYRATLSELWIPLSRPATANRFTRMDNVAGRLKPGVTIEAAQQELTLFARRLEQQYPETNKGRGALVRPLTEVVVGRARSALLTLLGAVGLVLFIACANVANLLLARGSGRIHEIGVRAALGASRFRVMQQLLTESVLLGLASGVLGMLLALATTRLVLNLASATIPRAWEIGLDWRVFAFLLAASVGAGIAFGLLPALAASRVDLQASLKSAAGGRAVGAGSTGWNGRRLRDGLVVAEIALSFVLLVSAGGLLRAFLRLQSTPTGLVTDRVLTLRITAPLRDYAAPGSFGRYVGQLEARVRQIPGVRAAGFIQYLPLQNWGWSASFTIKDRPPQPGEAAPQSELRYISPGYFESLRIPLRSGRLFDDRDTATAPRVILVNEALARKYFPNQDPVGRVTDRGAIIGVVGDVRTTRLDRPAIPEIYYAFVQNTAATSDAGVSLVVSAQSRPEALARTINDAIHEVNPRQVVYDVKTMDRVIANSLADMNLYIWLIGLFAALAVLLATSGIYGVISYVVAARTQEFGLRVALGAGGAHILRLVLGHGSGLVAGGMVLGVAGALAVTRLLQSLHSEVTAADPLTLAAVSVVLGLVGLAACVIPSRRAMQVDPLTALKYE